MIYCRYCWTETAEKVCPACQEWISERHKDGYKARCTNRSLWITREGGKYLAFVRMIGSHYTAGSR